MIFKVSVRKDGRQLAGYLLSDRKNDRVEVMEVRGGIGETSPEGLRDALRDMDEYARQVRAEKTIVHLAINPNDLDRMKASDWDACVEKAEAALGLDGQPRVVVKHVKEGKPHLHVAWSRVDLENGRAIEMSFCNLKAKAAAQEVELELDLRRTPERSRGMSEAKKLQDELRRERHQEQRAAQSPEDRKRIIASAWEQSADGLGFQRRLQEQGYRLVKGDRAPMVMDQNSEAFSIARSIPGVRVRDVREKLKGLDLPTIDAARDPRRTILSHNRARKMVRDELQKKLANDEQRNRDRERRRDDPRP